MLVQAMMQMIGDGVVRDMNHPSEWTFLKNIFL
jgi:hypothetical protein